MRSSRSYCVVVAWPLLRWIGLVCFQVRYGVDAVVDPAQVGVDEGALATQAVVFDADDVAVGVGGFIEVAEGGEFGKPVAIKTDNHPVFHVRWVKRILRWSGVKMTYSRPAMPWENGRIERLFGTFKSCLRGMVMRDAGHLVQALPDFRYWYNHARPHQHLGGRTPHQVWSGIDPYKNAPTAVTEFCAWGGRLKGVVLRH